MHSCYSTHLVPYRERNRYWKNVIDTAYFPLELDFRNPEQLHGNLSQWKLAQLGISRLESSATNFKRVDRQIDESEPYFLITMPTQEQVQFSQSNHSVVCNPGAFILERSDLPYEFSYRKDNALWVIRVPLSQLRTRIREPERYLYMEFNKQKGMGAVFFQFMQSIVQQASDTDEASHSVLSNQLIDLLAHSLENDDRVLMSRESGLRRVHLLNIENFVRGNIQRSELSPEMIACACQISCRYLHKLFKDSGQTVGQWIKELRLQSALNDIQSDRGHTTLAEIAYRWGFNDQAHFCRLFKARFGRTPREMRQVKSPI